MRKLTWNCDLKGCYHDKACPKLGLFDECFPGKIGMGDVDGIVEINGNFLILEWKAFTSEIPRGQELMFERLTALATNILVGKVWAAVDTDLDGLKERIQKWVEKVTWG
jgi:hypothetical protein